MAFVNLDTIHRPSNGAVVPSAWGDQINDNFNYINTQLSSAFTGNPCGRIWVASGMNVPTVTQSYIGATTVTTDFLAGGVTVQPGFLGLIVPFAGKYQVNASVTAQCTTTGNRLTTSIYNGPGGGSAGNLRGSGTAISYSGIGVSSTLADIVNCAAGDLIIVTGALSAGSWSYVYSQQLNYLSIALQSD